MLISQHSPWKALGLAQLVIFQQFLGTIQKESGPLTVPHGHYNAAALFLGKWLMQDSLALFYECNGVCLLAREKPLEHISVATRAYVNI